MTNLIFVVAAYLLGSISFAVLMSKAFGLPDPRSYGSGKSGGDNVLRSGQEGGGSWLTLLGDAAKGWWRCLWRCSSPRAMSKGRCWLRRWRCGVPRATCSGVPALQRAARVWRRRWACCLALNVWVGLCALATWMLVAILFRFSSPGRLDRCRRCADLCAALLPQQVLDILLVRQISSSNMMPDASNHCARQTKHQRIDRRTGGQRSRRPATRSGTVLPPASR